MSSQAAVQTPEVQDGLGGLATSSFWQVPPGYTAVRTSVGVPAGLRRGLVEWPATYPWGLLGMHDRAEFEPKYRARLQARKGRVLRELEAMRQERGALCFTCWETLGREGVWCHRQVLAAVLSGWLGVPVPEVSPVAADTDRDVEQLVEVELGANGRRYAYGWAGPGRLRVGDTVLLPANRASRSAFPATVAADTSAYQGTVVMVLALLAREEA